MRIHSSVAAIEIFDCFICREGTVAVAQVSRPNAAAFSSEVIVYIAGVAYLVESDYRHTVIEVNKIRVDSERSAYIGSNSGVNDSITMCRIRPSSSSDCMPNRAYGSLCSMSIFMKNTSFSGDNTSSLPSGVGDGGSNGFTTSSMRRVVICKC